MVAAVAGLHIAAVEADDLPALLDLWVDAWTDARPEIDFEARRPWFRTHLAELVEAGATLLVGHAGGRIIGFVTVHPTTGVLDQLAIARGCQGRGYAGALIDAAKATAPTGLALSVNTDNRPAVTLYRRHGFVVTGEALNSRSGLPILHMAWRPDGTMLDAAAADRQGAGSRGTGKETFD